MLEEAEDRDCLMTASNEGECTRVSVTKCYRPLAVLWSYCNLVTLHQVILHNHRHTQIRSRQRPQNTDRKRKRFNRISLRSESSNQSTALVACTWCISGYRFPLGWTAARWWWGTRRRGRNFGRCTSDTAFLPRWSRWPSHITINTLERNKSHHQNTQPTHTSSKAEPASTRILLLHLTVSTAALWKLHTEKVRGQFVIFSLLLPASSRMIIVIIIIMIMMIKMVFDDEMRLMFLEEIDRNMDNVLSSDINQSNKGILVSAPGLDPSGARPTRPLPPSSVKIGSRLFEWIY